MTLCFGIEDADRLGIGSSDHLPCNQERCNARRSHDDDAGQGLFLGSGPQSRSKSAFGSEEAVYTGGVDEDRGVIAEKPSAGWAEGGPWRPSALHGGPRRSMAPHGGPWAAHGRPMGRPGPADGPLMGRPWVAFGPPK